MSLILIRVIRNWQKHYHVAVLPARVKKPKDKAHVENGVQNVERWYSRLCEIAPSFSLGEASVRWRHCWKLSTNAKMQHLGKSRRQLFEELDQELYPRSLSIPMNCPLEKRTREH